MYDFGAVYDVEIPVDVAVWAAGTRNNMSPTANKRKFKYE